MNDTAAREQAAAQTRIADALELLAMSSVPSMICPVEKSHDHALMMIGRILSRSPAAATSTPTSSPTNAQFLAALRRLVLYGNLHKLRYQSDMVAAEPDDEGAIRLETAALLDCLVRGETIPQAVGCESDRKICDA